MKYLVLVFLLCSSCISLALFSNSLVEKSNLVEAQRGTVYSKESAIRCQRAISKANTDAKRMAHFPAYLTTKEKEILEKNIEDKCNVAVDMGSDIRDIQDNSKDSGIGERDSR